MSHPIQDTIEFSVGAEKVLVNDTVKIVARINALVAGDTSEEALRADIRATMKKFIDADWQFSNMQRDADTTGFERVVLTATARVSERENFNLDSRARGQPQGLADRRRDRGHLHSGRPDRSCRARTARRHPPQGDGGIEVHQFHPVLPFRIARINYGAAMNQSVASTLKIGAQSLEAAAAKASTYGIGFGMGMIPSEMLRS